MTKSDSYRQALARAKDWDVYLMANSGLPGPRANLELAQVTAELGDEARFKQWLSYDATQAPTNTPQEYLKFCGVVGLGSLVAQGRKKYLKTLRASASDPRWRVREGVAMALQRWGDADMDALIDELATWVDGNLYELRAAAAALCEPRLLKQPAQVKRVLKILDSITRSFARTKDRKRDDFVALKKGLAYCWSVAVAALPDPGKKAMEKWLGSTDPDVRAVLRENLKKDRLVRMDAAWVRRWESQLNSTPA